MTNTKTQDRGHCQCCGRQQAVTRGAIAKHGYTVEQGWFQGVCAGHQFAPIEQERTQADQVIASVRKQAAELREKAARYERGEIHPEQVKTNRSQRVNGKLEPIMLAWADANEYQQADAVRSLVWAMEARANGGDNFANGLQRVVDFYHGKPLLVVKVEAAAPRIEAGERRKNACGRILTARYQDGARVYYATEGGALGWTGSQAWRKMQKV